MQLVDSATAITVTTVSSGKMAIELLLSLDSEFDLVISDILMPEMDGFELLKYVTTKLCLDFPPVALLTSGNFTTAPGGALTLLRKPLTCNQVADLFDLVDVRKAAAQETSLSRAVAHPLADLKSRSFTMGDAYPARAAREGPRGRSHKANTHLHREEESSQSSSHSPHSRTQNPSTSQKPSQTPYSLLVNMVENLEHGIIPTKHEIGRMKTLLLDVGGLFDPISDAEVDQLQRLLSLGNENNMLLYQCFEMQLSLKDGADQQNEAGMQPLEDQAIPRHPNRSLVDRPQGDALLQLEAESTVERHKQAMASLAEHTFLAALVAVDPELLQLEKWEEIMQELIKIPYHEFDVLRLTQMLGPHCVLAVVTFTLMFKFSVLYDLEIDHDMMYKFLKRLGSNMPHNPYHNVSHVADVVQAVCLLMMKGSQRDEQGVIEVLNMTRIEILSVIFAAAIHDLQHPGVNNDFLIGTYDELAIRYNDRAVIENHSTTMAFRMLQEDGYDVFAPLDRANFRRLRSLVLQMVAATDMTKHFEFVSNVSEILQRYEQLAPDQKASSSALTAEQRDVVMCCALKLADIGHLRAVKNVHLTMSYAIREEFCRQGDRMSELDMVVPDMCKRCTALDCEKQFAKSQLAFFDYIMLPYMSAWSKTFRSRRMEEMVVENYAHWQQVAGS
eukprot:CAMPEP_0118934714 /NCGR_PEP_ID=MMETSP1169-20130426/13973_1 /TAXON_ID=36882 /ORGANISM="Pyramimonas obovata, Strain CCMP722" /LENGTH=670 /DNA_ID=CAMNT_0006877643 /DNA_START=277 /DNA_END=2289 /DNA_ORIENTATION=-